MVDEPPVNPDPASLLRQQQELEARISGFRARLGAFSGEPAGSAEQPGAASRENPGTADAGMLKRSLELRFEELGKLTRMLANCEKELEAANREIASRRIELDAMKASLSWRATAWLRRLGRLATSWNGSAGQGDNVALLRNSDLFDTAWYLRRYPDVAASGADPVRHYLEIGAKEGRDPGPGFDTSWYLDRNPDVARAGINPLVHYLRHGQAEWRLPRP